MGSSVGCPVTSYDLLAPLFEDGADPRSSRGRVIVDSHKAGNGWVSYGDGRLIQWDRRRGETGVGQDRRIPGVAGAGADSDVPSAARFSRIVTSRRFAAPFDYFGAVEVLSQPSHPNDGFKPCFLHEDNEHNWLFQAFCGSRSASLWQEDRAGVGDASETTYGRQWVSALYGWKSGSRHRWRVSVELDGTVRGWVDRLSGPALVKTKVRHGPLTGQVGWRADRTVYVVSDVVVAERHG